MTTGERLHGFFVKDKIYVSELGCDVYTLIHSKCGSRLTFIDREDDNKTFSVSFKTLPSDSTGVFHILEHSVLCGSEKYPLKDPFVELLKGSLNTFLNAMTFQDKTMYPVSSRNDKDFLNLIGVYMDAVLHPLAVKDPKAFYQEGWHYELDKESGELSYKGVVLNEMRGDYSSVEALIDRYMNEMLYKGTPYEHDSGGDPEQISTLTYEAFVAAHKKFYHPTNAELFLDGSVDLTSTLCLLDSFLSEYDRSDAEPADFEIPLAKKNIREKKREYYEIREGEDKKDKIRMSEGFIIGKYNEQKKLIATNVLLGALFANNESPVKKKILDSSLCEDFLAGLRDGILEPSLVVDFINVKDGEESALSSLFFSVIRELVKEGIDKNELRATLNSVEFRLREKDLGTLPVGVANAMISLESLLYSSDPVQNFMYEKTLSELREDIDNGYFEELLSSLFITNERRATLVLEPSDTLGAEREERERKTLASYRKSLSDAELESIAQMNSALDAWQSTEDSEAAKNTLPKLSLSDISDTVRKTPGKISECEGVRVINHDVATSGIVYTNLCFDISDTTKEELPVITLFNLLLSNLATGKHTASEVQREIKANLGGFDIRTTALGERDGTSVIPKVYLHVSSSALDSMREHIPSIVSEILTDTLFDDLAAVKSILRQTVIASEESFAATGHVTAMGRAAAASSVEAAVKEYSTGYESYIYLKTLDKSFDEQKETLKAKLYAIRNKYFTRQRLTVSITGTEDAEFAKALIMAFDNGEKVAPVCNISPLSIKKEGIAIPAQVAFAAAAYNTFALGETPSGSFDVARSLVGYEFLWSKVRVQGGAYGAGMSAGISGNIGFYSFRDPTPARTLSCFSEVPDFLRAFAKSGADITKYIIGAVGDAEPVVTPRLRAANATFRLLRGISYEDECALRRSMLATDSAELCRIADLLERALALGAVCVVSSKEKLGSIEGLDTILEI